MSVRLAVLGATGRMGQCVADLAGLDVELVGGVASRGLRDTEAGMIGYPRVVAPEDAREVVEAADVVLDVASPAALAALLGRCEEALRSRALVSGTTGLGEAEERALERLAADAPVVRAANFAVGVALLRKVARELAAALAPAEWDVEVCETHHRGKEDAPSGTALALGRAVAEGRGADLAALRTDGRSGRVGARPEGQIGFHALRGGTVAGEHSVSFLGPHERIELTHRAGDRALFARGALRACAWAAGRPPGLYDMDDVLGLATGSRGNA